MTPGRMTYHLRRLRLHGLTEPTPHTLRYTVTDFGLRSALVLTRVHNRFLTTVMADAGQPGPSRASPLGRALDNVAIEIDRVATTSHLAA
jgi:hypothetical protein